ncbi:MAG: class I SAM-dependent RNA methyltransferase [Eubacteriales bacterium]|nr:class I SAM-dependent RNA methyltransferase [Eubacteriales bacterium]
MKYELIATATFGLEAVVRREIEGLGYKIIKTEDGKVTFEGDEQAIVRSNLWLRCADRVLLKVAEFEAKTFEELFQRTKAVNWARMIPVDGEFKVTCSTVKSQLHNPPAIQSITKKAIVESLKIAYGFDYFKETGAAHTVKVSILKDRVILTLDTSGQGLHKRGYRVANVDAPIKETLAAALIQLSFFRPGRILLDPCCGSGTIPIEAALIAKNIAPGCNRNFDAEKWHFIDKKLWVDERLRSRDEFSDTSPKLIFGYDIDSRAITAARKNAEAAGVDDLIVFERTDVKRLKAPEGESGIIITNPPYGERIGVEQEIHGIFKALNLFAKENPGWSLFVITPDKEAEKKIMGRRADRRRKLYNGNIETTYYQFHGRKPSDR